MAKQNNYFTSMENRYGDNEFVSKLRPEQIQRSAKERIFKEMVRGQIDYTVYGQYFLEPKFLENLIIAAEDELTNKTTIANALYFYDMNYPGNTNIVHNLTIHQHLSIIYSVILNKLNILKYTGDIGILMDIQYTLRDSKNFM